MSEQIAAYEDCEKYFERAQTNTKGIRIYIGAKNMAQYLRMRMCNFRVLQRREATRMYEKSDPRWGKSINDKYKVSIKDDINGDWWVYVELWELDIDDKAIEGLGKEINSLALRDIDDLAIEDENETRPDFRTDEQSP